MMGLLLNSQHTQHIVNIKFSTSYVAVLMTQLKGPFEIKVLLLCSSRQ